MGVIEMRTYLSLSFVALMFAAPCRSETPAYDAAKVIAYAKTIDVAQLDPLLQSQPLEAWLRLGPSHIEQLRWRISSCDLKPDYPEPPDGYPLCVDFVYQRGRVAGWGIVNVGTTRKGIVGPPRFKGAVVSTRTSDETRYENAEKLSELPRVISRLLAETR